MLVFAAFTPHTPLLLPAIGKEHEKELGKTREALTHLGEELYASHPDTIVVLSGHGAHRKDSFSINLHDHYRADLSEFGDLTTTAEFFPDLGLMDTIQRRLRREEIPFTLFSDPVLDYGTAVPLLALHAPAHTAIVPVCYSGLDAKTHFEFGRALKDILLHTNKRVAVIGSGDLSHSLRTDSPAGMHAEGVLFDETVREAVRSATPSHLLRFPPAKLKRAAECGYRPLLILMGLLEGINVLPEELVYEAPFGVGYLVAHFHFD